MTVERRRLAFWDFRHLPGKVCVRRWGTAGVHMSAERHIALGWLPDGSWWVDAGADDNWVFTAPSSAEARAAAQALADERMAEPPEYLGRPGRWVAAIANHAYDRSSMTPHEAEVPEWPPGHEPAHQPDGS